MANGNRTAPTMSDIVGNAVKSMKDLWPNNRAVQSLDPRNCTGRDIERLFEVFAQGVKDERALAQPNKALLAAKDSQIDLSKIIIDVERDNMLTQKQLAAEALAERDRVLLLHGPALSVVQPKQGQN